LLYASINVETGSEILHFIKIYTYIYVNMSKMFLAVIKMNLPYQPTLFHKGALYCQVWKGLYYQTTSDYVATTSNGPITSTSLSLSEFG
jgi:hypothetical protein